MNNSELKPALPTDSAERKNIPLARGVLDYFPAALAEVARLSQSGNDKHNPGEELHWARGKSMDHADCIIRHLMDRGTVDPEDGIRHTVKAAWRMLALLQEELEAAGLATMPRGARLAPTAAQPASQLSVTEMADLVLGHEPRMPLHFNEWIDACIPLTRGGEHNALARWPNGQGV